MRVLISNSAFSDLENIKEHYQAQDAPEVGVNFISEIFSRIETLNEHPLIGRCVPEFNDDSIREIIHPPFRIVYLLEEKAIHVIRVWRSERLLKLPKEKPHKS